MKNRRIYYVKEVEKWKGYKEYAVTYSEDEKYPITYQTKEEADKKCEEWNKKYYLSYYADDEIEEFYNTIPFNDIYKAINDYLGMNLTFTLEPRYQRNRENPDRKRIDGFNFESNENLADMFPVIAKAWAKFKVAVFSNGISVNEDSGELVAWGTVDYQYEHLGAGTNGAKLLNFHYDSKEGLKIRTERQNYEERLERERAWKERWKKEHEE